MQQVMLVSDGLGGTAVPAMERCRGTAVAIPPRVCRDRASTDLVILPDDTEGDDTLGDLEDCGPVNRR